MWVVGRIVSPDPKESGAMDIGLMNTVREASSTSGLSAVGWGLLYLDLIRTIPGLQLLTGSTGLRDLDRGWVLENEWNTRCSGAVPSQSVKESGNPRDSLALGLNTQF